MTTLKRSFDEMQANIASRPVEERAKLASGCKAGSDALAAVASSTGC